MSQKSLFETHFSKGMHFQCCSKSDILYTRERYRYKALEQITSVVYLHVILFRIHEKDTATDKEFNTVLQMYFKVLNGQQK